MRGLAVTDIGTLRHHSADTLKASREWRLTRREAAERHDRAFGGAIPCMRDSTACNRDSTACNEVRFAVSEGRPTPRSGAPASTPQYTPSYLYTTEVPPRASAAGRCNKPRKHPDALVCLIRTRALWLKFPKCRRSRAAGPMGLAMSRASGILV